MRVDEFLILIRRVKPQTAAELTMNVGLSVRIGSYCQGLGGNSETLLQTFLLNNFIPS